MSDPFELPKQKKRPANLYGRRAKSVTALGEKSNDAGGAEDSEKRRKVDNDDSRIDTEEVSEDWHCDRIEKLMRPFYSQHFKLVEQLHFQIDHRFLLSLKLFIVDFHLS